MKPRMILFKDLLVEYNMSFSYNDPPKGKGYYYEPAIAKLRQNFRVYIIKYGFFIKALNEESLIDVPNTLQFNLY